MDEKLTPTVDTRDHNTLENNVPEHNNQQSPANKHRNLLQKAVFAFGNLGQAAFYQALSTYFIVYVTNSLFSSLAKSQAARMISLVTGLIVVIRIAEIFIDPLLGNIVDNTHTRFGRFRPWQAIGGTTSAILLILIYSGLFGLVNVNQTWFIILFVITFITLDVLYSLRDVSYWGMIPALSADSHERSIYTSLGTFTGSIGYNGITVLVVPLVSYFSFQLTGSHTQNQSGWTAFGIIVALFGLLTAWTVALGTHESANTLRAKAQKSGNPLAAFAALFRNDQLLWTALSYLLYSIANVATAGVLYYMFTFILNDQKAFSIVGVIAVIAGLLASAVYPIANRYIPRKVLYIAGTLSIIVSYLIFSLFTTNLTMVLIGLVLFYMPANFIQTTAILCMTDSIEYGQLKTGKRNEAVTLSVRPMMDKIAGAFSNGIVGFITVAAGMITTATAADMTPANIHTFKLWAFYTPMVLVICSMLIFIFFVRISEKKHAEIVEQLHSKLSQESAE